MTTTDRLLKTFQRKPYEKAIRDTGLQDHQAEAIADGVEKVSNDTDGYYGAMLKIWEGHDRRLDRHEGLLRLIAQALHIPDDQINAVLKD